jgi:hypothetical protein
MQVYQYYLSTNVLPFEYGHAGKQESFSFPKARPVNAVIQGNSSAVLLFDHVGMIAIGHTESVDEKEGLDSDPAILKTTSAMYKESSKPAWIEIPCKLLSDSSRPLNNPSFASQWKFS